MIFNKILKIIENDRYTYIDIDILFEKFILIAFKKIYIIFI